MESLRSVIAAMSPGEFLIEAVPFAQFHLRELQWNMLTTWKRKSLLQEIRLTRGTRTSLLWWLEIPHLTAGRSPPLAAGPEEPVCENTDKKLYSGGIHQPPGRHEKQRGIKRDKAHIPLGRNPSNPSVSHLHSRSVKLGGRFSKQTIHRVVAEGRSVLQHSTDVGNSGGGPHVNPTKSEGASVPSSIQGSSGSSRRRQWCRRHKVKFKVFSVPNILEFREAYTKVSPWACSSLRFLHCGFSSKDVSLYCLMSRHSCKGLHMWFPQFDPPAPLWDLTLMLQALQKPPLGSVSLQWLTLKTAFLLAITMARSVSENSALSCKSPFLVFHHDRAILRTV